MIYLGLNSFFENLQTKILSSAILVAKELKYYRELNYPLQELEVYQIPAALKQLILFTAQKPYKEMMRDMLWYIRKKSFFKMIEITYLIHTTA